MFNKPAAAAVFSVLFGQVMSHGLLASPAIRKPGAAFRANCGDQIFNNVNSDPAGNIQALEQLKQAVTFKADECNLSLCKGLQFADVNAADIQAFAPGQNLPVVFDIRAPHTGVANLSIVDTATNTVIGSALKSFDVFASTSVPIQADQTHFNVTLPTDLGDRCAKAGDCVLQFFWDARSIDQTYESCVDFTMSGSGSAPAPAVSSSAAPATTAATITLTIEATATAEPTPVEPITSSVSLAATAEASAPCGFNAQLVRRNAKWARCGGLGWLGSSKCPEDMECHRYNAYYSACI
ncbi:Lytic polysaccharide mono-oxygenase, cellulose-degrading [Ceratobasidium sp. AG-Ba]|nr:Lytic polysaccharide mono-oxygenase, cellulose-degrading [Ceratobasidium sp. AG-Ba]